MSNKQKNKSEKTATDKLTTQQKRFVAAMAMPDVKNQTEAAVKAGCPPKNARITACRWLTKANILQAIEERKNRAISNAGVTPEEVLGSAVFNMRSSIDDLLDESGSFDIEKARATGAIDLIKKYRLKIATDAKTGDTVSITEIEMYSPVDARKEVANYIRLERQVTVKNHQLTDDELARELLDYMVVKGFTPEGSFEAVVMEYPKVDIKQLSEHYGIWQYDEDNQQRKSS